MYVFGCDFLTRGRGRQHAPTNCWLCSAIPTGLYDTIIQAGVTDPQAPSILGLFVEDPTMIVGLLPKAIQIIQTESVLKLISTTHFFFQWF